MDLRVGPLRGHVLSRDKPKRTKKAGARRVAWRSFRGARRSSAGSTCVDRLRTETMCSCCRLHKCGRPSGPRGSYRNEGSDTASQKTRWICGVVPFPCVPAQYAGFEARTIGRLPRWDGRDGTKVDGSSAFREPLFSTRRLTNSSHSNRSRRQFSRRFGNPSGMKIGSPSCIHRSASKRCSVLSMPSRN